MKKLLEFIIKGIVNKPEEVEIKETINPNNFTIKVAGDDMGTVIGKQGKIIKAIRTLTRANFQLLETERV